MIIKYGTFMSVVIVVSNLLRMINLLIMKNSTILDIKTESLTIITSIKTVNIGSMKLKY